MSNKDDASDVPLQYQKAFGAGLKRKRIDFVPQSGPAEYAPSSSPKLPQSAGDLYLSIVLPKTGTRTVSENSGSQSVELDDVLQPRQTTLSLRDEDLEPVTREPRAVCDICHLPKALTTANMPHEASFSHQVCLNHVHPPSSLDRRRKGFKFLHSQGWDPDARLGLGADGGGILHPIKPKVNEGKTGIGANPVSKQERKKTKILSAGEARASEAAAQKRGKVIEQLLYGDDQVNKHLGIDL